MSIPIDDIMLKMIAFSASNLHDIEHFIKVYAYAKTIGSKELADKMKLEVLETAAILHDIACPLCRAKYGSTAGHMQEFEGADLSKSFLAEFALADEIVEQIVWLVAHHHTYSDIKTLEHQILLEADFLVNACESSYKKEQIMNAREGFFRTKTGIRLLDEIYLRPEISI